MFKNKNLIIFISMFLLLNIKNSYSNNIECINESENIICNYEITTENNNASDLGTYNININLIKVKNITGIINGNMLCVIHFIFPFIILTLFNFIFDKKINFSMPTFIFKISLMY